MPTSPDAAMMAIWNRLDGWLRAQLRDATRSALYGKFNIQRQAIILKQIRERILQAHGQLQAIETEAVRQWFEEGQRLTDAQLRAIANEHGVTFTPRDTAQWAQINEHAIQAIANDMASKRAKFLGEFGGIIRQTDDYLRTIALGELPKALIGVTTGYQAGMSIREQGIALLRDKVALQDLAEGLNEAASVRYADGTQHSLHAYGQMAAQTGIARAQTEGSLHRMQQNGVHVYQVIPHGSLCALCAPYEGTCWAIDSEGEAMGYRRCPVSWPRHPYCWHPFAPFLPGISKGEKQLPDALYNASDTEHRTFQRTHYPEWTQAARQGFSTTYEWERAVKTLHKEHGLKKSELRGMRWRYAGIEQRRIKATEAMLKDPNLSYAEAMRRQTRGFMGRDAYWTQRVKTGVYSPTRQQQILRDAAHGKGTTPNPAEQERAKARLAARVPKAKRSGPIGTPVSEALNMPPIWQKNSTKIRRAVKLIDQVHGDGILPKMKIRSQSLNNAYGIFRSAEKFNEIGVDNHGKHDHPVMTTLHEIGHFLDRRGLPGNGFTTNVNPDAVDKWWQAIYNSKKYADLKEDGDPYMLSGRELFARSYAQFIATQTSDAVALRELAWMRKYEPDKVWNDADFTAISAALKELFRGLKWLR